MASVCKGAAPNSDFTPPLGLDQYDVMIVGEAPGEAEDRRGMPFQGRTGLKLINLVERSGLDMDRIFVTNIVRCRPPKNRRPSVSEMKSCLVHIRKEIELIQPKVIILLGNSALRLFNLHNEGGINRVRGNTYELKLPMWEDSPIFTVIPTLHPAAFLHEYNPRLEESSANDYKLAAARLKGVEVPTMKAPTYEIIDTEEKLNWLVDTLLKQKAFSFDTETPSLRWWEIPVITYSFSWGYPNKTAVLPLRRHDPNGSPWKLTQAWADPTLPLEALKKIFLSPVTKFAHNLKFDYLVTQKLLDIKIQGKLYCTLILHHLLDEYRPHDLEFLGEVEFGYGDYSSPIREIVGQGKYLKATYDHIPDEVLYPYTATDAEATWRLGMLFIDRLCYKPHLLKLYDRECEPLLRELARSEWYGVPVDLKIVGERKAQFTQEQDALLAQLRGYTFPDFNPGSPAQVAKACNMLGFGDAILDQEKANGIDTSKKRLTDLSGEHPFFGGVLKYRNYSKLIGTYLENIEKDICLDGRLRYSWRQAGPETGRLAVTLYHQLLKHLRDFFPALPGYKIVTGDYSQVELRILAYKSLDREMIRCFEGGTDVHAATTEEILGVKLGQRGKLKTPYGWFEVEVNDHNRDKIGKGVNFGLAYGSQGHNLVKTVQWQDVNGRLHSLTWNMLEEGMLRWRNRFSGVVAYQESIPELIRQAGGVQVNDFGRERRFGKRIRFTNSKQDRQAAEREALNFPIQSNATHIMNGTLVLISYEILRLVEEGTIKPDDVWMLTTLHDAATFMVRERLGEWFINVYKTIGQRPIPEIGGATFPMEIGMGDSWLDAEKDAKRRKKK